METKDWLKFGRQNHISLVIGGKEIPLRYTCHQHDCYRELITEQKRKLEEEKAERKRKLEAEKKAGNPPTETDSDIQVAEHLERRVSVLRFDSVQVVEIALNPEPGAVVYPREDIEKLLDLDQIAIIAQVWVDRKVFNPRLNPPADPHVAPQI